jgi:hypothetical protein
MAILDSEKIDFLWKKIIYGVTKTANASTKFASNETIPSPLPVLPSSVWKDGDTIPATPPAVNTAIIRIFAAAQAIHMTADPTAPLNVAWIANAIFGDFTSRKLNFIPPTFGTGYAVKVWIGNPIGGPAARIFPDTTNEEWVFDYTAGTLVFTGNIPSNKVATIGLGTVSVASHGIFVEIYQYVGSFGVGTTVTIPPIPHFLGDLVDVEAGTGTPTQGMFLRWIDGVWQADNYDVGFVPRTLYQLKDVEISTNATEGDILRRRSGVWQSEALPQPFIPTRLGQLADVEDGTGTPQENNVLTWKNGVWQAEPGIDPTLFGTMAFQNADDVNITGGIISGVIIDGGTF